MINEKTS